jgi:polysaccharide biosynthesis protein PslG
LYSRIMSKDARASRLLLPIVVILAGCVVVGAKWLVHARHDDGKVHLTHAVALSKTTRHTVLFGMSDPALIHETAKVQAAQLTRMRSIGLNSIRLEANWSWVQFGGPDKFVWTALDQEIRSARAAKMTVELIIDGCPRWACRAGTSKDATPQPASAPQFATWAATVAKRYKPLGVNIYEIWNEPNLSKYFAPGSNPAFYTKMLIDSYRAIKHVDPSAFILAGGLAPGNNARGNYSPITFLQDMYANGAKGYFNAVSIHPYCYPLLPGTYAAWSTWSKMSQTKPSLRSVMNQHGNAKLPIWITEFGAPSGGPTGIGPKGEAAELSQAIAIVKATSWLGAIYIYTWEDAGHNPSTILDWFGLLNYQGHPKPAYGAVASAIRK